ncbi:stage 0 sporulation protein J [Thermoclostridium stercorarium subsp. stercorarium DSM 8532]|uniref:Stage 0 sporulation protein J n=2 Tax=Thermoclostridium stercorarium TaxID=1510 RepID=L7VK58_THES1|nr:ParB/RepB/Spo0J family partition protein [Thermoclostridium stercorarium]AGC67044.1 stage 0 sporulation protein J [Thermoclostridium stercorarium subsp. stercorarium DSM 8532]AGI38130.1 partition protein [Thermoclostridium stercorarium subsp. stercorarium DSM 8532]UZQ85658.1 ParB/RepB/Spo0J family partition protein [Thermoclostridium stercorarium]
MKKGLGKGLGALLDTDNILSGDSGVMELKIIDIEPNKEQPRKNFDQEKLQALAESIKQHGVVQPIIVKKQDKGYTIIAGERRWRAAKLAGLKTIPAIVKDLSSRETMEIALIENLQREDLNPIEEAEAYQKLMDEHGLTQEALSKLVGKSRAAIANSVRLLSLPDKIKDMLINEQLTPGHARALITVEDPERQIKLAEEIIEKDLSVRETEKLVNERKNEKKQKRKAAKDPTILDIEEKLKSILGTKVELRHNKNKGKIVIEYYSNDEFNRIIEFITKDVNF